MNAILTHIRRYRIRYAVTVAGVLIFLWWFVTYHPVREPRYRPKDPEIDLVINGRNFWGTPMRRNIYWANGASASGPVDEDGDVHGRWTHHGRDITDYSVWYYYHGEQCTKAEYYRWSN